MSSIFDKIISSQGISSIPNISDRRQDNTIEPEPSNHHEPSETNSEQYTSSSLKKAIQELLKDGALEAARKPNLYQTILIHQKSVSQILEPLDLAVKIDEIRGLAFVVVAEQLFSEDDEWAHPLIRRQRLTLDQSLVIAILRQYYIAHEQEKGIGAGDAKVDLDDLLPQLQVYLGDSGSDAKEQKRLRNILEKLKVHGIVSEIDAKDQVTVRPLITHLAGPESLANLLHQFKKMASEAKGNAEPGTD